MAALCFTNFASTYEAEDCLGVTHDAGRRYALGCDWTERKTPILTERASVASVQRGGGGARSHGVSVAPPIFTKLQFGRRPAHWSMNRSTTSCTLDFCRTSNDGRETSPVLRQMQGQHTSWSLQIGLIDFQYNSKNVT